MDYDLSGVRIRTLSAQTMVEIAIRYEKLSDKLSTIALSRALGGALTQAQVGDDLVRKSIK